MSVLPQSVRAQNLAHFLSRNARQIGARPAIISGERRMDWAELDARVSALAAAMRDRFAIRHGDRVLVQLRNSPEIIETMLACWRLGAVWVPANYRQSPEEAVYLAQKADTVLMICEADYSDHAAACTAACRAVLASSRSEASWLRL